MNKNKNYNNNRILVTGGAGFIGSHLVDELLRKGNNVIVVDNLSNGSIDNLAQAHENANFRFIEGDITNYNICEDVTKDIDIVFHLACLGVRHSLHSPIQNHLVNAGGTLNILEAAKINRIKKFFYISTSEIYGKTKSFPIKETDTPCPITVYGSSKLAGEHYTNSYFEGFGLDTTIIRIFNNYGPRSHYEGDSGELIPRSIVNILSNKPPIIFGDGSVTRDFLYVKDTARILSNLLGIQKITGKTFNLGAGKEISIKEVIEIIKSLLPKHHFDIEYMQDRPADVPRLWVDNTKMKQFYNYELNYDFECGMIETIDYFMKLKANNNLIFDVPNINWNKK